MMNYFSIKKIACVLFGFLLSFSVFAVQTKTAYTTYSRFDERGLLLGTISSYTLTGYLATRNIYDVNGILIKVESGYLSLVSWQDERVKPENWSGFSLFSSQVFTYDTYGRKATVTVYDKTGTAISLTQTNYDTQSRPLCQAVRMNRAVYASLPDACSLSAEGTDGPDRITKFAYDDLDQPLTTTKAFGTSLSQTYVTNTYTGRLLTSQTDANGNRTDLYYDSFSRLKRMVYPSPTTKGVANGTETGTTGDYVEFTYDANGNKKTERKRNGKIINYTPDANNRVIVKDYVDNTKQADVYLDYDLRGLLLSSRFNSTSGVGITNSFDGFGRLKTTTSNQGISRTLTSNYDDNGNRNQLIHADGQTFSYSFDQLNRVTGVAEGAIEANKMLSVIYNTNGRRNRIWRNNQSAGTTYYLFTNGVQLDNFQQTFADTANNLSNSFTFNQAGQITTLTQSNSSYFYTGNENRTGVYAPDGLNRYSTIAGQPMGYDLNSNLTNDGFQVYTYDDENRLLTTSSASATSNFVYDPNGRLFQVTINGTAKQFLYDGDALVAEYDTSGNILKRYVHGDQVDEPWVQYNGSAIGLNARRYLHADHQGSIIAHSDSAGNIALQPNGTPAKFAYDGFGIPLANNSDSFGYTGQIYFKELNLNYYKARFYSPKLGRFLQTDPIGYKDDMDLYSYVGNDFINKTDPTGEFCIPCAAAVIGGVGNLINYGLTTPAAERTAGGWVRAGAIGMAVGGLTSMGAGSVLAGGVTGARVLGAGAISALVGSAGEATSQKLDKKELDLNKVALAGSANVLGTGVGAVVEKAAANLTTFVSKTATITSLSGREFNQTVSVTSRLSDAAQGLMAEGAGGAASTIGQTSAVLAIDAQQNQSKCNSNKECK